MKKSLGSLGAEVPYQVTVEIEQFRVEGKMTYIDALDLG